MISLGESACGAVESHDRRDEPPRHEPQQQEHRQEDCRQADGQIAGEPRDRRERFVRVDFRENRPVEVGKR